MVKGLIFMWLILSGSTADMAPYESMCHTLGGSRIELNQMRVASEHGANYHPVVTCWADE